MTEIDLAKRDLILAVLRWVAELDGLALASLAGRPITARASLGIYAGDLELAGLDFNREPLSVKTETRRITSGEPAPVSRDLADLRERLDGLLADTFDPFSDRSLS